MHEDGGTEAVSQDAVLAKVLANPLIAEPAHLAAFLRHVVHEEHAGRGELLKAYSIGVDALGLAEDFNPQEDSIVRVAAKRLRSALATYYDGPGSDDTIQIDMPRGGYRPVFSSKEECKFAVEGARENASFPGRLIVLIGIMICLAGIGLWVWQWLSDQREMDRRAAVQIKAPIVEITPFSTPGGLVDGATAQIVRRKLVSALSGFKLLQVRVEPVVDGDPFEENRAHYMLGGAVVQGKNGLLLDVHLDVHLHDTNTEDRVVSERLDTKAHATASDPILGRVFRRFATHIASDAGLIRNLEFDRLLARTEYPLEALNSYECVLYFHAFNFRRDVALFVTARSCLENLTENDSREASVWAAWGILQFLTWTRIANETGYEGLDSAMMAMTRAIELDRNYAPAQGFAGMIAMIRGEHELAADFISRASDLNPSDPIFRVLEGWNLTLDGLWAEGILRLSEAIGEYEDPPGWSRIPLVFNAWRRDDYAAAMAQTELILAHGDKRFNVLALASAIALGDQARVEKYRLAFLSDPLATPSDPLREVRNIFNAPEVLVHMERVISLLSLE